MMDHVNGSNRGIILQLPPKEDWILGPKYDMMYRIRGRKTVTMQYTLYTRKVE